MKKVLAGAVAFCMSVCAITGCVVKDNSIEMETELATLTTENIDDEYITERFYEAYDFWYAWLYGVDYAEYSMDNPPVGPYISIVSKDSSIQTAKELEEEIRKHFEKELADKFLSQLSPKDSDGRLLVYDGDVGDNGEIIDSITVEKLNAEKYALTLNMTLYFTDEKYQEKVYYVLENGKWVFENDSEDEFFRYEELPGYLDEEYAPYNDILRTYYAAMWQRWDAERISEKGLTDILRYSIGDDALDKIGFSLVDVNNDGKDELLIGEITDGVWSKVIFDIYTEKDGRAYQVALGWERNRYYLCEEENGYIIANEASSGAANSTYEYYVLDECDLKLIGSVLTDGWASPENPWFKTSDTDHDVINDEAIDEETYWEIIESYEEKYITPKYIPFETLG